MADQVATQDDARRFALTHEQLRLQADLNSLRTSERGTVWREGELAEKAMKAALHHPRWVAILCDAANEKRRIAAFIRLDQVAIINRLNQVREELAQLSRPPGSRS